jgi:hypothetical protein
MMSLAQTSLRVRRSPLPEMQVQPLASHETAEVCRFLNRNPLRAFGLLGMIARNGLTGAENRGTFYGCRDYAGTLRGVALIGHFTLVEARQPAALQALAAVARRRKDISLILGEESDLNRFWSYYKASPCAATAHAAKYILLAAQSLPATPPPFALRPATMDDLEDIVAAHAQGTLEEKGCDPLQTDPENFRRRCAQRIERQVTWLCRSPEEVVFKAELICAASSVAYLEGVWVPPHLRGGRYGRVCLAALGRQLLEKSRVVCLLADYAHPARISFYQKTGFMPVGQFTARQF